jgi:predicted protein tyrosine phosphatase
MEIRFPGLSSNLRFVTASREEIEYEILVRVPHIIVSISDPGTLKPRIRRTLSLRGVLRLRFHDAEPSAASTPSTCIKLMRRSDAERIWKFITVHAGEFEVLLAHCQAGISRSAGVVLGVGNALGINVSRSLVFTQPNLYVAELVESVGRMFVAQTQGAWHRQR